MPYNTRRKSLSLPSLGIHLPSTSRSHRSPSTSKLPTTVEEALPPTKKIKRSHDVDSPESAPSSPRSSSKSKSDSVRPTSARRALEQTPPPSPADTVTGPPKIDTQGLKDDVIVAVIEQLEKTGNRPHLGRELAVVLSALNESVARYNHHSLFPISLRGFANKRSSFSSANPTALVSSRLSAYLKRPWTALAPCPIAKELVPVHPRKVFYFLTTYTHQPFPENVDDLVIAGLDGKRVVTPSVSSASVDHDEEDASSRDRSRLSPSPEIDLSSPEFEEDQADDLVVRGSSSSGVHESGFTIHRQHRLTHNHRAASPPLEGDEREFTQTASSVRERASEEKAGRQGIAGNTFTVSSEAKEVKTDSSAFVSNAMEVDLIAGNHRPDTHYEDYFSYHGSSAKEEVLDEAAAATLFGTSPSPSLSSVSSLSSGTTAASDARSTSEEGLVVLKQEIASTIRGASPVLVEEDAATTTTTTGSATPYLNNKRPIVVIKTGLPDKETFRLNEHEVLRLKHLDSSADLEGQLWSDLRSPETVDIDELDAMFGEV